MRAIIVMAILLAGCVIESSASEATISADVSATGSFVKSVEIDDVSCPDQTELSIDIARLDGDLTIKVLDGAGAVAFEETYTTGGEFGKDGASATGQTERSLFGAAGEWTLRAEYEVFELGFRAQLTCQEASVSEDSS